MVKIKEVKTRKDLRIFAGFNEKMYRDVPQAIPDLISDEMANFMPKKNPAFEYAETDPMLENNIKVQSMWRKFDKIQYRRRRCWIKELGE